MSLNDPFKDMDESWRELMDDYAESRDDPVALHRAQGRIFATIGQMMWTYTQDVSMELKSALHVTGHARAAVNVCRALVTLLPGFHAVEDVELPEGLSESVQGVGDMIYGVKLHDHEGHTAEDEAALQRCLVAVLRARGIKASLDESGNLIFSGMMDTHFDAIVEEETAKFAEDIEKELGESAPDVKPKSEGGWW